MASKFTLWFLFIFIAVTSSSVVRRHISSCPHDCKCLTNPDTEIITYHCSSLDFVNKLSSKENAAITSLDISNIGLQAWDKRLKKLVNLERLNLAHNKISDLKFFPHLKKLTHLNLKANHVKTFSAKNLPTSLRSLDISHNYIQELPRDITKLRFLRNIALYGDAFSCNTESLETRDILIEHKVKIVGQATCDEPEKFKGQSWFHVVDFDEFFRTYDQEGMLADAPEGSGEGEGSGIEPIIIPEEPIQRQRFLEPMAPRQPNTSQPETTTSDDMFFESSGEEDIPVQEKHPDPDPDVIPIRVTVGEEVEQSNLGTNIFLGVFFLCLVCLLIYAVKKNKERKRETRRRKRETNIRNREENNRNHTSQMEMINRKPIEKQNGNDAVPLMNGQNGKSESEQDAPNQPLLETEDNGDLLRPGVTAVKVRASEIPDSVPQTPIMVNRTLTSDGNVVLQRSS